MNLIRRVINNIVLRWKRQQACRHPEYCSGVGYCSYCHGEDLAEARETLDAIKERT